jgi:hypothetical protein
MVTPSSRQSNVDWHSRLFDSAKLHREVRGKKLNHDMNKVRATGSAGENIRHFPRFTRTRSDNPISDLNPFVNSLPDYLSDPLPANA